MFVHKNQINHTTNEQIIQFLEFYEIDVPNNINHARDLVRSVLE